MCSGLDGSWAEILALVQCWYLFLSLFDASYTEQLAPKRVIEFLVMWRFQYNIRFYLNRTKLIFL